MMEARGQIYEGKFVANPGPYTRCRICGEEGLEDEMVQDERLLELGFSNEVWHRGCYGSRDRTVGGLVSKEEYRR